MPTPPELGLMVKSIAGVDTDDMTPLIGVVKVSIPQAKPGGVAELLQENIYNFGMEYKYNDFLFARGGYLQEHKLKGNRQYVTLGFGLVYNVLTLIWLFDSCKSNHAITIREYVTFLNGIQY